MNKLLAVDGNSLLYRSFFALPEMNSEEGVPTNAVYGFLNMLLKMLSEERPSHVLIAFDEHGPTFRHKVFGEYKAGRPETPESLRTQMTLARELLGQMGVATVSKPGLEADDMLGIYSRRAGEAGMEAVLVTGDRDALQLVDGHTSVVLTKKGITETVRLTAGNFEEQYGVAPQQMIEVKSLMGDASDNIPGVPGVGEKTAFKLIREYGTLEGVLAHIPEINGPKLRERLTAYAGQARMSREIGTIVTDPTTDTGGTLEDCRFTEDDLAGGRAALTKLGLRSIVRRLPEGKADPPAPQAAQEGPAAVERGAAIQEVSAVIQAMKKSGRAAFLLEEGRLTAAAGEEECWCFPVSAQTSLLDGEGEAAEAYLAAFLPVFLDEKIEKTLFDVKQAMHRLAPLEEGAEGLPIQNAGFDLMIAAYLLHPLRSRYEVGELCEAEGLPKNAASLFSLRARMEARMAAQGLTTLFTTIEMPLVGVLFSMEQVGFLVDAQTLKELGARFSADIARAEQEIYRLAGETFNILSPKQLGAVLFEKLGLPHTKKRKTGYSTDAETLEYLSDRHPIAERVLEYRKLTKLQSTYIDGLTAARSPDGRVRTRFNQTVTATGRISSAEPNLQNIPVRTELGREIRKAFVASEGNLLVGGDYSQIELRVLAHMADDERMCAAFCAGEDIHARTAAEVFGVPLELVTPQMRSAAKAVNFGIVYGISDFGLAKNINSTRAEAAGYIQAYLERYPGVKRYMEQVVEEAKQKGYVVTAFGRRRDMPELKSSNYNTRSFGERAAMNAPIQGTAADIIKLAMVQLADALQRGGYRAKLVLQVHDELIVDTPLEEVEAVQALLKSVMEGVVTLKAPLVADVRAGHSWYDTK